MTNTLTQDASIELRKTLGRFPTGVILIAAEHKGRSIGMLANSFGSVSLNPPLVQVSFADSSTSWPLLAPLSHFGISVLSQKQSDLIPLLQRDKSERFSGIDLTRLDSGALFLPEASAAFHVETFDDLPAGDHTIRLLRILDHWRDDNQPSFSR